MRGKGIVCVAIGLTAVASTFVDRLDHRQYAYSDLCRNESLVSSGGRFARLHCMYHSEEWSSPSKWIEHTRNLFLPTLGGELSMALGYAVLNLMSWLNWFVGIAIAVCAYRCVTIVYTGCVAKCDPPSYKCK